MWLSALDRGSHVGRWPTAYDLSIGLGLDALRNAAGAVLVGQIDDGIVVYSGFVLLFSISLRLVEKFPLLAGDHWNRDGIVRIDVFVLVLVDACELHDPFA